MQLQTKLILKVVAGIGSVVGAAWAVDGRYVTERVFTEFKSGTVAAVFDRLDRLDAKTERIDSKLDQLLERDSRKE